MRTQSKAKQISIITGIVAGYFGVTTRQILGRRRPDWIVWPRHVACALMHIELGLSYSDLGRLLRRNYGTIHNSCGQARNRIETEPEFAYEFMAIQSQVRSALRQ